MSADNFVGVMQNKTTGKWHVWDGCASCDYPEPPEVSEHGGYGSCVAFDTKEQAISEAIERDGNEYYEYGYQVLPDDAGFKPPPYHVLEAIEEVKKQYDTSIDTNLSK